MYLYKMQANCTNCESSFIIEIKISEKITIKELGKYKCIVCDLQEHFTIDIADLSETEYEEDE